MTTKLRLFAFSLLLVCLSSTSWSQLVFTNPFTGLPTTSYILDTICQGQSIDHCFNVTSGGTSHTITSFTGNTGTVVIAPPTNPFPRCFRYTAPFGFTGSDVITFTVTNNLGQTGTCTVTIAVANPNTPINAGVDQQLCSPTNFTTLTAVNPDPLSIGYWTKLTGPGVITGGTNSPLVAGVDQQGGPTINVSNLQLGSNIFIYNQNYPCANNVDVVVVYVYNGFPPVADANTCFPSNINNAADTVVLCGTSNYTLCANNPGTAATGTWTIFCGSGTIFNINNASAPISNLGVGCNCLEWNIGNGPCPGGETKDTLYICTYPTIQTAVAPNDLTRCIGSFTNITLAGNTPSGANTVQWTFLSGPVTPTISTPNAASTVTSGFTQPGVYCFEYKITSGPCGSSTDQVCVFVYSPTSPVNAGVDQTICLPNNSATLAATAPTSPATGVWSVVSGTGSFVSPTSPTTVVNGLSTGLNRFRWTVSNGNCANNGTSDLVDINVFPAAQPIPNAGPDQNICFIGTALSTTINGNAPTNPGTGLWTISPATATITSPTSASTTVTGLTPGVYTLTWTLNNGSCSAAVSDQMIINVFNGTVTTTNAGLDQNLCTPNQTANMNAQAATSPSIGTWTIIQGGGSIAAANNPNTVISSIPAGVNIYRWTINNGTCGSYFDEVTVNVFNNNLTVANAGIDQELCATGGPVNTTMAANTLTPPTTGIWTGPFAVVPPNSPTGAVSNLPVGTHNFTWTIDNGPCGATNDVVQIRVFGPGQTTATAGIDQQLCSNNNNAILVANSLVNPASGEWTIINGGGTLSSPNTSSTMLNSIPVGVTCVEWAIYNGPCTTPASLRDTLCVTVFPENQTPASAGADIELCSTSSSTTLSANTPQFPATGLWTVNPAGPVFANSTSANTTISNLTPGTTYNVRWSISNGPCGGSNDELILNYYNNAQPVANAGADQQICAPANSVTMAANSPDSPATGVWSVVSGPNTPVFSNINSESTTVSGLIVGTYVFRWTINNGNCFPGETFDEVSILVFDNTQSAANAGPDVEVCEPVSLVILSGNSPISPATGLWSQVSGPNTAVINNPNLSTVDISNLIVGCYVFRWTVFNSACANPVTSDEVQICVFDDSQTPANAGPNQIICSPTSTTNLAANTIISPSVGTWSVISGPNVPLFSNINASNATISDLVVGTYVLQWSVYNGACAQSTTTDQMTIQVFDSSAPVANAGSDQSICSPTDQVTAQGNVPVGPAIGTWTLISGSGTIVDLNNPNSLITNLPVGINCFQWTINNGGCGSGTTFDTFCVDVFSSNQSVADAGPDQDLCSPQSSTLLAANTPTIPATGTWTQLSGPTTVTFSNPGSPTSNVSGLVVGCYEFEWTIDNGVCANPITSDIVQICVFDSGFPPANAGDDQELCSPQNSTQLAADPAVLPGIGTWSANPGNPTAVTFSDINDPNATVSGLAIGVYSFNWALDYSACGSESDNVTITVYDSSQGAAVAGADQQLCTPTSSTTLSADAVLPPGFGTWSVVEGAADFVDANNPNTVAFNLQQGIIKLVWTVYNGPCLAQEFTTDTITIELNDVNQLPASAGMDQEFCTPFVSTVLEGNGLAEAADGIWTTSGSSTISDPTNPITTISDLIVGENEFCWTITNGVCDPPVTTDCVSIFIFDQNQQPADAGADQDICSSLSDCTTLEGNAVIFPAQGTWTLISGQTNVTFDDENDPATQVCGLVPGIYVLQWCIENGPCGETTCDQMTITVYDNSAPTALAGSDQEICTPQSSVVMIANEAILPGFGQWNLISGGGDFVDADNPETDIINLPIGENQFSWCIFNGVCPNGSTCDTLSVFVFDETAADAFAGDDQDWCEPVSSVIMQATPAVNPAVGTWSPIGNTAIIADINDPNTEISGLTVGEYFFLWTVYNGPCDNGTTTDVVRIRIFSESQDVAFAGDDQQICTPQSVVTMNANAPTFPATAQWSANPGSTGNITSDSGPTTTITGLQPGTSCFTWTISNGPCIPQQTTDVVCIEIFDTNLPPADAGDDIQLCAPFDLTPIATTLTGNVLGTGAATGEWTQVSGPGSTTFSNPNNPVTDVDGLVVGEYLFRWTINNGPCGSTQDDVLVKVNDPNHPAADAGLDASYCTPTSCHTMDALDAVFPSVGTWQSITPGVCLTNTSDANTDACCLPVGENIFLWCVDNGACGQTCDVQSIFIYDQFNPDADAGLDQEICLPLTEVTMNSSFPLFPAIGQWSVLNGCDGIAIADVNNPFSAMTNLCEGTQCFLWTVNNGPCPNGMTMDTICVQVFNPEVTVQAGPDQSICTPQSSVTMNGSVPTDPNVGTWFTIQGGGAIAEPGNPQTTIDDLPVGINTFVWQFYNGVCENGLPSDTLSVFVYDETQPAADAGDDIELCFPITAAVMSGNTPIVPATGVWSLVSGSGIIADPTSPSTEITGMEVGDNIFVWTIDNGPCNNAITTDTVVVHVFPENPQVAVAGDDQSICTPESSVTLNATNPELPSTGQWVTQSLAGIIADINNPNTTVDFLAVGTHVLIWEVYNGPCDPSSTDEVTISVYDATQEDANAGEDQELCSPVSIAVMNGNNVIQPAIGTWTLGAHPGNPEIVEPNNPLTSVNNFAIGITELIWTIDNGPCGTTTDTVRIVVYDPLSPSAAVDEDQFLCDIPQGGCVDLIGSLPTFPAFGWWEQIAGDNIATIADTASNITTACGLGLNESAFVWHVYNGDCANALSTDTIWFYIYDSQVAAANAGPDVSFCGSQDVYTLEGSQLVGTVSGLATGLWTANEGSGGLINTPTAPDAIVEDIPVGVHCYTWTVDNGACGSTSDEMCITSFDPQVANANAGEGRSICSNEFDPFNLAGSELVFPATGQWSVLSGPATLENTDQADASVISLGAINTPLVNVPSELVWTVNNGICGTTSDTILFVLEDCETIKIPDAFSPNGDGTNDVFFIPNLQYYPNNNVKIFNRWGALIYEMKSYKNDWDGTSNASATIGELLPVSTYYYVLDLGENYPDTGTQVFTGFVYLKR